MPELFANTPSTTVSSGGTTAPSPGTVETWTVTSSSGFPAASSAGAGSGFHIGDPAADLEIIAVTNISGLNWTVTRGAEGSPVSAHTAGFTVVQVLTAGWLKATTGAQPDWINACQAPYLADNTGATDPTTAVQAAIAATNAIGGVCYCPAGTYKFSSVPLTLPGNVTLLGAGHGTHFTWDQAVVSPLIKAPATSAVQYNRIRDIRFSQTNATPGGTCIEASYFQFACFERLLIDSSGGGGNPNIGISYNSGVTHYNEVSDCVIFVDGTNAKGIQWSGGANANAARNIRCLPSASDNTQAAFYVNAYAIEIDRPDVENAAGSAIWIDAGATSNRPTVILAPYFEANGTTIRNTGGCPPSFPGTRFTIIKPSDTGSTTTSLVADPDLTATLLQGRVYTADFYLVADGPGAAASNFSYSFDLPANAAVTVTGLHGPQTGAGSANATSINVAGARSNVTRNIGLTGVGTAVATMVHAIITTGTVTATFDIKWGQQNGPSGTVTLYAGSSMTLEQIG